MNRRIICCKFYFDGCANQIGAQGNLEKAFKSKDNFGVPITAILYRSTVFGSVKGLAPLNRSRDIGYTIHS